MAPRKSPPAKPAAPKKRSGGKSSGYGKKVFLVLLALLVVGALYLVAKNYYAQTVRDRVESVVGELDPAGISIRVADAQAAQALLEKLRKEEGDWLGIFKVASAKPSKSSIRVEMLFDSRGYSIEIYWEPPKAPPEKPKAIAPKKKPGLPKLAILIDDMGGNLATAKDFLELPFEVTPAIIPHLGHSTAVATLYSDNKRPFLLHMPMEPKGYPSQKPGQGAIMSGDAPDKVRGLLAGALASVPGAIGINNHMGSKATESKALMAPVMEELKRRGMLFVDSETSEKSVAASVAKSAGIHWAGRDIFLDNEAKGEAIEAQLALAVARAKKNGTAIAIGHDRPETLKTLKKWSGKLSELGVELVPVTEVVH